MPVREGTLAKQNISATIDKRTGEARNLTLKERELAAAYIMNGGNATRAAMAVYNPKNINTAKSIGSEVLNKPDVRALIDSYAMKSAERIEQLADGARSEYVKLEANKDILDRAGYKAIERTENISIHVELSGTLASKRKLEITTPQKTVDEEKQ